MKTTNSSTPRYGFARRFVNFVAVLAVFLPAIPAVAEGQAPIVAQIVVLGDSLTAGYGLNRADSFPVRLQTALAEDGIEAKVINAGVSGDTTAGGLARLDWALADSEAGSGIDLVIVELGANDGLRGLDPGLTAANLDKIIAGIKKSGARVLLTGMKAPPNLGARYGEDFDAIFPRLAAKHDVALYPFFLEGVAAIPTLNQKDGIHPNREGVDIIVRGLLPLVKALLPARG
ncbi:MAG: arylesterase [Rhodospirillales bacterium]|nr:arylesterase [Rhodospirillales bacterium]